MKGVLIMNKKTGTILGIILGIIAFIGVVALLCYIFRDKLRMLCNRDDECDCDDCDCCCDEDDYFEVLDDCDCDPTPAE